MACFSEVKNKEIRELSEYFLYFCTIITIFDQVMNVLDLSEQEIVRRGSLEQLRKMNIDPYPAAAYPVNGYAEEIKANFNDDAQPRQVTIAGRIMSRRIMGKASFMELQDSTGRIQVYITREDYLSGRK